MEDNQCKSKKLCKTQKIIKNHVWGFPQGSLRKVSLEMLVLRPHNGSFGLYFHMFGSTFENCLKHFATCSAVMWLCSWFLCLHTYRFRLDFVCVLPTDRRDTGANRKGDLRQDGREESDGWALLFLSVCASPPAYKPSTSAERKEHNELFLVSTVKSSQISASFSSSARFLQEA